MQKYAYSLKRKVYGKIQKYAIQGSILRRYGKKYVSVSCKGFRKRERK